MNPLCEAYVKRYRWPVGEEWSPCGAFSKGFRDGHAVCGIHLRAKAPAFNAIPLGRPLDADHD